ncbi:MAG: hypothetical protein JW850_04640 [Thermoflexales bacterium]|nr:hypothetical protein [Thermoflexales bacterium]
MRLEGQTKLGYYPTPDKQTGLIATWLKPAEPGLKIASLVLGQVIKAFDPCCGKGEALAYLAAHLKAESYGIELSDSRAAEAKTRLDHVVNCGYEYAILAGGTFSFCLLNPPYDGEGMTGGGARMEETFLTATTPRLMPQGILAYVIPHSRISDKVARHLFGWYGDVRCFRFAGDEYDVFRQVVILGVKREAYHTPGGDELRQAQAWAGGKQITGYEETVEAETETSREMRVVGEVEVAVGKIPPGVTVHLQCDQITCQARTVTGAMRAWADQARAWLVEHPAVLKVKSKKVQKPVYAPLAELPEGHGEYVVPPAPLRGEGGRAFCFKYVPVTDDDYLKAAEEVVDKLESSRGWLDLVPPAAPKPITPAMTPKQGHIAMQLSGGLLWTCDVVSSGKPMLLKGNVSKIAVVVENGDEAEVDLDGDDDDDDSLRKVVIEERFKTTVTTLTADGTIKVYEAPDEIANVLRQHVAELAERLQSQNVPLYDFDPQPWEWAVFDPLSRGRKLPGREETGFTDYQRHVAIASGRVLLRGTGNGFNQAEMGAGKTTMALGTIEYLRAAAARHGKKDGYPALVVGPGIVTGDANWPKETREVVPGAVGKVVEITAKPVAKPVTILDYILTCPEALTSEKSRLALRDSIRRAMRAERYQGDSNPYGWCEHARRVRDQIAAWENRQDKNGQRRERSAEENVLRHRIGGFLWLGLQVPRDPESEREIAGKYSLGQFVREYQEGSLPDKSLAIMSFETAKLGPGRVTAMGAKTIKVTTVVEVEDEWGDLVERQEEKLVEVCTCPTCGRIVAERYINGQPEPERIIRAAKAGEWIGLRRRFCQAPRPKWVWDDEKGRHVIAETDDEGKPYVCGAPLFEETSLRREAGAVYVSKKARDVFRIVIVDEVHEAKAKGTGVGWALSVLSGSAPHTMGLTGTLFGGYSTSIFWLLYRLSAQVRQEFGFNDDMRWAKTFGLIKRTFYVDPDVVVEDGAYTGTRHHETTTEKPGISPAIAGVILPCCTFSGLKDIGLPLPSYSEHMVGITPTAAMDGQLSEVDGSRDDPKGGLFKWALEELEREDGTGKGAISVWLNAALNRPNAMFRPEDIFFNRRLAGQRGRGRFARRRRELILSVGAVIGEGELLPKEKWLVNTCQAQKTAGRKALVYVRQTGERDIQERLVHVLGQAGLQAGVLRDSVNPRKRVDWITRRVDKLDVLITNAKLVKVGLNLVMFPTTVFYEMDWSLYVVWQAMRRVYRPGAPRPVELYFPYYYDTLEEHLLSLVGQKMRAAQILYGDDVAGALVEGDEGDLIGDLVRGALKGTKIGRPEGVFGMENTMTASPMGSPTALSPRIVPNVSMTELWEALRRGEIQVGKKKRTARQVVAQIEKEVVQGTLF